LKRFKMRKMFPLRLFFARFWRGRPALSTIGQRFRSASQLPSVLLRKISLLRPSSTTSRFSHLPRIFARALSVVVPVVLLVTFFAIHHRHQRQLASTQPQVSSAPTDWQTTLENSPATQSVATRPVFPYSIVPGGVRDRQELQSAAADPIVAQHYQDFQISRAHTIRLEQPQMMYVSYRRNNQVFWTRNRMLIPAGETLITDGKNLARVRCANRLSRVAALPVAVTDPAIETLNEPSFVPPLMAQLLPGEGAELFPGAPAGAIPGGPVGPKGPGTLAPPSLPPILLPGASPITPNTPIIPPPVSTPEPGIFVLLVFGTFSAALLFFRRR
jgi:hypothetical protein